VRLPNFTRATTFRWTLAVAGGYVLCTLVLFGFVYWRTTTYFKSSYDSLLTGELHLFTTDSPEQLLTDIDDRLRDDPRHIRVVGLFGVDGHRIAGNIESLPPDLTMHAPANAVVVRVDSRGRGFLKVRLIARASPNGEVLVLGRNIDELAEIAEIDGWALALSLLPGFVLAVAIGMFLSLRAHNRLSEVNRRIQRIVAGDLRERLPTRGRDDPFDQLAVSVNGMLEEIEALIREIAGVGDNIAHDLRTPLTRVRVRLERARASAPGELGTVVDQAIVGLDQSLAIITALLRIAEIEHSRRLDGFSQVSLAPLIREVGDFYDPIAEDKGISLWVKAADEATVQGDRDLLFEAVANLVDNAVKFTPGGGRVELALLHRGGETVIQVKDNGPGIPENEREAVTKRFYRSDRSRRNEGLGLGLSLVAAIVKLHGFRFTITASSGCTVEIVCPQSREVFLAGMSA
jgi:signal transduction histidine kinase